MFKGVNMSHSGRMTHPRHVNMSQDCITMINESYAIFLQRFFTLKIDNHPADVYFFPIITVLRFRKTFRCYPFLKIKYVYSGVYPLFIVLTIILSLQGT